MPVHRHPVAVLRQDTALSGLPVDLALVARLRSMYERIRGRDTQLARFFYARLFAVEPRMRALFRGDPHEQAQKLTAALDTVVRNFENPGTNAAMLSDLGKRHAAYGVLPEHYDLVIDLLVESMSELLKPDLDLQGLEEWRMALRLISNQMIIAAGGAIEAARPQPNLRSSSANP